MIRRVLRHNFSTLLIADTRHGMIHPGNLNALAAAQRIKKPIDVLVLDSSVKDVALMGDGVQNIYVANHDAFHNPTADVYSHAARTFIEGQKKYTHVVTMASQWTKDYFPRIAATLNCQPLSEVIDILDETTFRRPTYAGNAINTVKSPGPIHFLNVRATNFDAAKAGTGQVKNIDANTLLAGLPQNIATFVKEELKKSERPELGQAKIVISGGRGNP